MKKIVFQEMQTEATSIATSVASFIDKQALIELKHNQNSNSNEYIKLQKDLQDIRNINRRSDIFVKYLYVLTESNKTKGQYQYLLDAEESNSNDYSPLGQIADEANSVDLTDHLLNIYSPNQFTHDQWGDWLTAYAPVFDSNHQYIATVGVNLYAEHVINKMHRLLIYCALCFVFILILILLISWVIAHKQSSSLHKLYDGVNKIGNGEFKTHIEINSNDEFSKLAAEINNMAIGLQQRELMQQNFARYVSKHVMDSLIQHGNMPTLSGEKRKITLLFSDIRQFTHISEQYTPEQVVKYLNEYFSVMVEIIFRNNGVLDKFIGDGMMVEFGVPIEDNQQEINAVNTAIEMVRAVKELNNKWLGEGKKVPDIKIGVGIHTGLAVIGNIGSEKRYEYTAIGDTVNSASRIEQLTKEYQTPILFSEETANAIKNKIKIKYIGAQQIRGKTNLTNLYTIDENI